MHRANVELQGRKAHCQQHKGNGDGQTLTAGVEELLHPVQQPANQCAQTKTQNDLDQGLHHDGQYAGLPGRQGSGDAEGHGEQHQTNCVVDGHYQHQQPGQGAVGLILPHHHQCGGGGGGGSDGAQHQSGGDSHYIGEAEVQTYQHNVHQHRGDHSLENANGDGAAAHSL